VDSDWNGQIIHVHGKLNPYQLDYSLPDDESYLETGPLLQAQFKDMQQSVIVIAEIAEIAEIDNLIVSPSTRIYGTPRHQTRSTSLE
jgi:hypothetical protein